MSLISFETERLICRPTLIDDAPFILELLNTPKWHQFIGDRNVHSVGEATQYIETRMLPQLDRLGYGNYTVIHKENQSKMGTVGLFDREGLDGVDVGFAFLPLFEGKGYAYEASSRLMELAKTTFDLSVINAITVVENKGSQRLLVKLGLQFEKMIQLPNDPEKLMFYSWKK